jgi:hypothetical protein
MTYEACSQGHMDDKVTLVVATTGYTRVGVSQDSHGLGQGMSKPFWQVRWAYGPNYGVFGSMWIEKLNGSDEERGHVISITLIFCH